MTLETKLLQIHQHIPKEITLVAVSKTKSCELITQAHQAGLTHFAENYLQEALSKIQALKKLNLVWHFIGAVQNNKTKVIAENFDWLQSLSQLKTVERLAKQRPTTLLPLNVCIQVNIDGDENKSGVPPDQVKALAKAVLNHPAQLRLRGLMAIPKVSADMSQTQKSFEAMRALYDNLKIEGFALDTLSMGMSQDFKLAIACGATMVRIGSALFGAR